MDKRIAYPILILAFLIAGGAIGTFAVSAMEPELKLLAAADFAIEADLPLPVTLRIPKIGVDAEIAAVGVNEKGEMDVPEDTKDVGWYEPGTIPGARGQAVVAGHLDNYLGQPLVFARLAELEEGDDIYVVNENGAELRFTVTGKETYPYDMTDTSAIFGPANDSRLNLITCEGTWVQSQQSYDERTVVFAKRVLSR
jgi:sortase A